MLMHHRPHMLGAAHTETLNWMRWPTSFLLGVKVRSEPTARHVCCPLMPAFRPFAFALSDPAHAMSSIALPSRTCLKPLCACCQQFRASALRLH